MLRLAHLAGTYEGSEVPFAQLTTTVLPAKSSTVCCFIDDYSLTDADHTPVLVDFFIIRYKH